MRWPPERIPATSVIVCCNPRYGIATNPARATRRRAECVGRVDEADGRGRRRWARSIASANGNARRSRWRPGRQRGGEDDAADVNGRTAASLREPLGDMRGRGAPAGRRHRSPRRQPIASVAASQAAGARVRAAARRRRPIRSRGRGSAPRSSRRTLGSRPDRHGEHACHVIRTGARQIRKTQRNRASRAATAPQPAPPFLAFAALPRVSDQFFERMIVFGSRDDRTAAQRPRSRRWRASVRKRQAPE